MRYLMSGVAAAAILGACTTTEQTADAPSSSEASSASQRVVETTSPDYWGSWGIDTGHMDSEVRPGDNFFMHVSGNWFDEFELPADKTRYGAFDLLREKSEQQTRFIIEDLAAEEPPIDTAEGKVAAFYNAYMATDAIEAAGMAPAQPYLDQIAAIDSREALAGVFMSPGFSSPINGFVWVDDKNPDDYIFQMSMGGLGLPDREYYLKDDEKSVEIRAKYEELLTFLLGKAGYDDAAAKAADVLALETQLAQADWDRAVSRNPEITYNKLTRDELIAIAGDFPLATALEQLGVMGEEEFLVTEIPPTAEEIASAGLSQEDVDKLGGGMPVAFELANTAELDTWKAYLAAHMLSNFSSVLPSDIDDANFAFYGTALSGQPEQRPRWKRAVSAVSGTLGEAIGEVYVDRHFPAENKERMDELVANLRTAMHANLEDLEWMGEETRERAREKLDKFNPKIGYPVEFEGYETLEITDSAFQNSVNSAVWQMEDNLSRLNEQPDRNEWFMTPQTVNAYYNPGYNEIVFPAAILQPPFFNISADPAVNYGAIGGVIGHEMGHGFDDQGSKYNGDGVLANWWTESDRSAFDELTTALVAQYNQYCPLGEGDPCVNGRLTLGENIGDLGGLSLAYRAYQISLDANGDGVVSEDEQAPVIDGYTGDQRFFMAWAQVWRAKYRDEAKRNQLLTDPHSPPEYRVNGIVRNFDEWYEAFDVAATDELYLPPEERIRIW
ncbi:MAG TPA: M13 family peptidase [Henriciella marina]|uniref:M13 family metallopeptidase n=1 Tax=Henriciella sp. TaxID=1968823 RepID=UPI00181C8C11|nr:M13 family metallopeptidase [Henriciella sp.]HIG20981.1 M13 family peptidase [Henriciella sp.]HIK65667.1 M13 family peptidase [Henriciella marina]